ncbi:MAG TPA: LPS export ABC transporter periplasmic protein LptC [Ferruginibacter sp.]|nr:LPS export ABC transporter periplasmic protein LptC [Ferruginibacter sp.]HMP20609.1 LPS export ABC transporter periplasmic protein LptC [Ferruginibacter sp.]
MSEVQGFSAKSARRDEAREVTIRYSIGGAKKALLKGPLMNRVYDTADYVEFPNTVHVDFFNEATGVLESWLDARYAKFEDSKNLVFLKDSVRVFNTQGDTLYCNELYWDRSKIKHEFFTDKPVRIRRKMEIIDGVGMDASQDFTEWHILQPVGLLKVPDSEFPD